MMVMRPSTLYKTPPTSRGTSPNRGKVSPKKSPSDNYNRSRGSYNSRSRTSSPSTSIGGKAPSSRGSESGSIERLDDSGNLTRIITSHGELEDNINVVVRVRPLNEKEKKGNYDTVVEFPGNGQLLCENIPVGPNTNQKSKLFSYNVVFEPGATQEDVLEYSGIKRLIEMSVEGFSCTAFCYGQTGSGKTHTLTGPPGLIERHRNHYSEDHGLVFRSFMYLFKLIQAKTEFHFTMKASFLEIYNEKVIDLLNPGSARKPLAVRWSKKLRGFFVENLFTVDCEEFDDLLAVLEEGMRNRKVGSHSMNEHSSRSHTILTVHINSEQAAENGVFISRQGKINFVDLAGSEMTKKTHSEGKTLEEANNINKSLMVLGYCISSLSDSKRKGGHIPYRDSKLTKLLADSLAGNGVTLMIACISPARSNLSETLNTLRYAARAKRIRTKPIVVMDPREALILSLKREVRALQTENEHLRTVLHLHDEIPINGTIRPEDITTERRHIPPAPKVDPERLTELESSELSELIKLYMNENEALRQENAELFSTREIIMRDQELVCRENERLLKKLEDVNSVCCRSPIIPAQPTIPAELLSDDTDHNSSTNVWTNPLNGNSQKHHSVNTSPAIPESIQKELEKRRIGSSMSNISNTIKSNLHKRHFSWDERDNTKNQAKPKMDEQGATDYTKGVFD
ncbi:kinesin-like protein KIF12 [Chrysoperla carnea]|uniref:kinesin-like protein KIF12 n=1 Tax=Chrysoperla carnea TaxID=189513 RepID=UPI001D08A093|nr:kinesin-like protein KIF12 [Chrysoperla carnea]